MMRACETNFRHVNRDGEWPDFQWLGLELSSDGTLRLPALPRLSGTAPTAPGVKPSAPAGIAVDWDGSVFYSDPSGNRVLKIDGCSGETCPARGVGASGDPLSVLDRPRGLLIPATRRVLYVADSGHHRVLLIDPETGALQGVLGASGLPHAPTPSDAPGRFNEPWALAADADGNVYVVDHGNRRVQKFDAAGLVDPLFWQRMEAEGVLDEPADIAIADAAGATRIYVLDRGKQRIVLFDEHGRGVADTGGEPWQLNERLTDALGLAATATTVFAGDNAQRRVLQFRVADQSLTGEAVGFDGFVAALALTADQGLLVHGGASAAPTALSLDAGHGARGLLWGGPFVVDCPEHAWRHVRALATIPQRGAHLEFFWRLSPLAGAPAVAPDSDDPFPAAAGWRAVGRDLLDFSVSGDRTHRLWLAARLSSDGSATATVAQLRLQFDRDSYHKLLPSIYQEPTECGDFFDRFLALFESVVERTEDPIHRLPVLSDPDVIPAPSLSWLASWLGLELDEAWDEATQREALRRAYERYARRGTPRGLRDAIARETGVHTIIHEPVTETGWWALPKAAQTCGSASAAEWTQTEGSILGWTTTLVASEPQGAILGTTAALDRSDLITDEEFAAPLFDEVAHQLQVLMYPAVAGDHRTVARVRDVIEREKPAHVTYHLCIAKPELRVGIQARLGVDAIVTGEATPTRLSDAGPGGGLVLAGAPRGRLGPKNSLGVTARL